MVITLKTFLIYLFFPGNYIGNIHPSDFEGFNRNLLSLSMASNSLVEIPDEAFRTLSSLRSLDLRDNNIRIVRNGAFHVSFALFFFLQTRFMLYQIEM